MISARKVLRSTEIEAILGKEFLERKFPLKFAEQISKVNVNRVEFRTAQGKSEGLCLVFARQIRMTILIYGFQVFDVPESIFDESSLAIYP